ncbi:MAG: hypothetical protein ABIO74_03355 [Dokdonella sp.]
MVAAIPAAFLLIPFVSWLSVFVEKQFNLSGQLQTISHGLIASLSIAAVLLFAMRGLVFRRWVPKA